MGALTKESIMTLYPRGHNWAADEAKPADIGLTVIADPTANPDGHASYGAGRHRGPVCVRCGEHPCYDCGMVSWSRTCPQRPTDAAVF